MGRLVKKEFLSMWNSSNRMLFRACIADLIDTPSVQAMRNVSQHVDINCFEHCVFVAYVSFLICRRMGWDFRAASMIGTKKEATRGCMGLRIRRRRCAMPARFVR